MELALGKGQRRESKERVGRLVTILIAWFRIINRPRGTWTAQSVRHP